MTHEQAMRLMLLARRKRRDYLLVPGRWEQDGAVGRYSFAERAMMLAWVKAMETVAVEVLTATPDTIGVESEYSIIDRIERDGMVAGMVIA